MSIVVSHYKPTSWILHLRIKSQSTSSQDFNVSEKTTENSNCIVQKKRHSSRFILILITHIIKFINEHRKPQQRGELERTKKTSWFAYLTVLFFTKILGRSVRGDRLTCKSMSCANNLEFHKWLLSFISTPKRRHGERGSSTGTSYFGAVLANLTSTRGLQHAKLES